MYFKWAMLYFVRNIRFFPRSSVDDAEVLRKELASIQRLMDELASAKEMERDVLQSRLDELQMEHEALKNKGHLV